MELPDIMAYSPVVLRPEATRTVIRPFVLGDPAGYEVAGHNRAQRIVDRIQALEPDIRAWALDLTLASLVERHRDVENVLMHRFEELDASTIDVSGSDRTQSLLIGAYFSEEYSYEAAALFNPSMVLHPDQSGVTEGRLRFVMSLRCIGEGHVSSLAFRTGTWGAGTNIVFDEQSEWSVAPRVERGRDGDDDVTVRLHCGGSLSISETVIFPITPAQRQGIEDLRLVRFTEDDGSVAYFGTYTAFSGSEVREEMLRTTDFSEFTMRPITGSVANSKGLALFPRKVGGRYMAIGRQDNENLWLLESDDIYRWDSGRKIITPKYAWEFIQMGNCGSPIEIDEGWLLLTHGVGTVRNYCIGAALLDKDDPSKVISRTRFPLMKPNPSQRDGYVPNVVYSCGAVVHDRTLLLPYGVADSFTAFATTPLDDLLAEME